MENFIFGENAEKCGNGESGFRQCANKYCGIETGKGDSSSKTAPEHCSGAIHIIRNTLCTAGFIGRGQQLFKGRGVRSLDTLEDLLTGYLAQLFHRLNDAVHLIRIEVVDIGIIVHKGDQVDIPFGCKPFSWR